MESKLYNVVDRAVHDGTKTLTIIMENEDNQKMKYAVEDFLNGFYYQGKVELLENGIKITF
jgi:hypothetical protein